MPNETTDNTSASAKFLTNRESYTATVSNVQKKRSGYAERKVTFPHTCKHAKRRSSLC